MDLNVVLNVPEKIAQGISDGSLERVGSVVRDSSSKKVVTWLQEGGSDLSNPPLAGGMNALAKAAPMIGAVNVGVSVAGFAMVLNQLNHISDQIRSIESKVDRISEKLDDQIIANLKAGINACQDAVELKDPSLRTQVAGQALTTLHSARQYFNQQVARSVNKLEATTSEYVVLAFIALSAEVQTYLHLDEGRKAVRTLKQGLKELRPSLIQLMNAVLDCTCHFLRPEFFGQIDLDLMLWLHNGFRRMKCDSSDLAEELSASQLFELMRPNLTKVWKSKESWHGEIPQVVVDTSDVPDWWIGPLNQGIDKTARLKDVEEELSEGLNKIVALVEGHDRLVSQAFQLEEMENIGLKPSSLQSQLQLPEGQAAAVLIDAPWVFKEAKKTTTSALE